MADRSELMTALINEVFALNGGFLAAGDALARPFGLTAAQWQVVGFLADGPATVAEVARRRGLRRQSVQETINRLLDAGLVDRRPNPDDRRAPLVVLTARTREALGRLESAREDWARELAGDARADELAGALEVLRAVRRRLAEQVGDQLSTQR